MSRTTGARRRDPIRPVDYRPPSGYGLDLQVLPVATLRDWARALELDSLERIEFHLVICITAGACRHVVDFEAFDCAAGSLLIVRPGQVQRFDERFAWDGWLLLFRPEMLQPRGATIPLDELELFRQVDALPTHLRLAPAERGIVIQALERMVADSSLPAPMSTINSLLRSQLHAFLIRLHLVQARTSAAQPIAPVALQRFERYRLAVEREFRRWHRVGQYAQSIGCSERSLTRATSDAIGKSSKAFLVDRIVLEAKRLLAHTSLPIAVIADQLGFDEATNFVKFFRREVRMTPLAFRRQQAKT